jgi:hypothetical protein
MTDLIAFVKVCFDLDSLSWKSVEDANNTEFVVKVEGINKI